MGFFLAVMAALCNAIASVLQRRGASTAPDTSVLRVKLMTFVLRRPVWVIGFLTMVGAFLFQAGALAYGEFMERSFALDRAGHVNRSGRSNPLRMATLGMADAEFFMARVPISLQRALMNAFNRIGRALGYDRD